MQDRELTLAFSLSIDVSKSNLVRIQDTSKTPPCGGASLVGHAGFEPATHGLRVRCSATELMARELNYT